MILTDDEIEQSFGEMQVKMAQIEQSFGSMRAIPS